jgi:hypothetical protein
VKRILALAIVGLLGWYAYQEIDLGEPDVPAGPSVGYPVVDAGDGVVSVGEGAKDAFGR